MSKKAEYEAKTEELLEDILNDEQCELYDIEYIKEGTNWYLRVYIDKQEGVTIDDCEKVSRALSDKLDEKDFIKEAYILEVSSPGLGRILKKDKHLEKSLGEEVEIHLYKPLNKKKEFIGLLESYDKETITIKSEADNELIFKRSDIAMIRLTIDF
ncbi:MAG: ribosome maturation factor RimP [Eubacterium sp.]